MFMRRSGIGGSAARSGSSLGQGCSRGLGDVVADRLEDVGALEDTRDARVGAAVADVRILEEVDQRAAAVVLADDVRGNAILLRGASSEEREEAAEEPGDRPHGGDCILRSLRRKQQAGRFAERVVEGFDDGGAPERIVIWIERKEGGLWAVGRAVNPQHRPSDEPRRSDYLFEGYELQDALEAANGTLEDDARVSEQDGRSGLVRPFRRSEILGPLERWFFGRR
jgi:hypothetical protein